MFSPTTRRYAAAAAAFAGVVRGQRVPVSVSSPKLNPEPMVTLAVGTPPQLVTALFDSGSPLIWTRGIGNGTKCPVQYDPSTSSTDETVGGNTSFAYGIGYFSGPSNMDSVGLVLESSPDLSTTPMYRNNVTSATTMIHLPICDSPGTLGMNQESQFLTTYFANQQDAVGENMYYVANFNMEREPDSWFEIGSTDVEFETSKCADLLPPTKSDRLDPAFPASGQPDANFSLWWQFDVDKFTLGDMESSGQAQTFVDDGTAIVLGNFASIFSPDPVPEGDDLCAHLCENDATFDFFLPGTGEAISLGIEDLMYYNASSGEKKCYLVQNDDIPETLIVAGFPFYNKYFIKHDYTDGGQVCFADKPEYPRLSSSSEICPVLLSPSKSAKKSKKSAKKSGREQKGEKNKKQKQMKNRYLRTAF